jgi:hypothetical protein
MPGFAHVESDVPIEQRGIPAIECRSDLDHDCPAVLDDHIQLHLIWMAKYFSGGVVEKRSVVKPTSWRMTIDLMEEGGRP